MKTLTFYNKGQKPVTSLGIGVFDGLHLGHRQLSRHCDAILTFYPHPVVTLNKEVKLSRLSTVKELQVHQRAIILRFTKALASISPEQFLDQVQLQLQPKQIVVGYDFRFGKNKSGNLTLLHAWGKKAGIAIKVIDAFSIDQSPVKSSDIRRHLQDGNMGAVYRLLGRPYLIQGRVIHGDRRGTSLGYPTANLYVPRYKLLPPNGVYGGSVQWEGSKKYTAIIYIGTKPTFNGKNKTLEIHIPDMKNDLYGKTLNLFISQHIRAEMTFPSKAALIQQIKEDLDALIREDTK